MLKIQMSKIMTDFSKILEKAKEIESKVKESQEKIKSIKVDGSSGGGNVKVTLNGEGEMINLEISKYSSSMTLSTFPFHFDPSLARTTRT